MTKLIALVVFYAMDRLDAWTGHDFFACWNAGGETSGWRYAAHRLFLWSEGIANGPFEAFSVPCEECDQPVSLTEAVTNDGEVLYHEDCIPEDGYIDNDCYEAWA